MRQMMSINLMIGRYVVRPRVDRRHHQSRTSAGSLGGRDWLESGPCWGTESAVELEDCLGVSHSNSGHWKQRGKYPAGSCLLTSLNSPNTNKRREQRSYCNPAKNQNGPEYPSCGRVFRPNEHCVLDLATALCRPLDAGAHAVAGIDRHTQPAKGDGHAKT